MKKRALSLVLILMCSIMVVSSCGDARKFMKYAGKEYTADVPFVTSQQITSVSGEVLLDRGNLMVFVDRNVTGAEAKYSVYNAKSNSVLFSYTVPEGDSTVLEFRIFEIGEVELYTVVYLTGGTEGTVTKADLYQENLLVANFTGELPVYQVNDTIVFGYSAYSLDDGILKKEFDVPDFGALPVCDYVNEDYRYLFNDDDSVTVYDRSYNIVGVYNPSPSDAKNIFILGNGNIVSQSITVLPDDSKDYTLFAALDNIGIELLEDGQKHKIEVKTEIYNPGNGKVSEKKFDKIIGLLLSGDEIADIEDKFFSDKTDNVAIVLGFENKTLSETPEILVLDNDLKVKASMSSLFANALEIERIGPDAYLVTDKNDNVRLVNGKGKIIYDFGTVANLSYNEKYIIGSRKIYDHEMNLVYDFSASGYKVFSVTSKSVLLYKEADGVKTEYAIFNGSLTALIAAGSNSEITASEWSYFVTRTPVESGNQYKYYNAAGQLVATFDSEATVLKSGQENGYMILSRPDESGNTVYIRFSK